MGVLLAACSEQQPLATEPVDRVQARYNDLAVTFPAAPSQPSITVSAAPVVGPGQAELILNGGFESNGGVNSGVLTSWTIVNAGSGGWFAQSGTTTPPTFVTGGVAPPEGSFAAMTSQPGPGSHILYQDIVIPPNGNASLSLQLWYRNHAISFFNQPNLSHIGGANQRYQIDIMDPAAPVDDLGAGVLLNVFATAPGDPASLPGYTTVTADLSAFNGQAIRLRITEVDNLSNFHAGVDDVSIIATINQAPTANAGADQTVECTGTLTDIQLDGTAADADGNIVSIEWFDGATLVAAGEDPIVSLPHGTHTLTLVVTDALGETASDDVIIDVVDTTAPTAAVSASPGSLWPPNHQYVPITLTIDVGDNCDDASALTVTATAVSNEADDAKGNGDGNTTGDVKAGANVSSNASPVVAFNPATDQLELRAERAGRDAGRTYTITITVSDTHGNSSTASTTVTVAHNQ